MVIADAVVMVTHFAITWMRVSIEIRNVVEIDTKILLPVQCIYPINIKNLYLEFYIYDFLLKLIEMFQLFYIQWPRVCVSKLFLSVWRNVVAVWARHNFL